MKTCIPKLTLLAVLGCAAIASAQAQKAGSPQSAPEYRPYIPQTWDDMRTFDVPLAEPARSPEHVSWEYYYRVPWRPIYKSYAVYAPGHEPLGYYERLHQQEPEVVWGIDSSGTVHKPQFRSEANWAAAGEIVFDSPIAHDTDPWGASVLSVEDVRDPAWYAATGTPWLRTARFHSRAT